MSVDERDDGDDRSTESSSDTERRSGIEASSTEAARPPQAMTKRGRRYLRPRTALVTTLAVGSGLLTLVLLLILGYWLGFVDRYVAGQIKDALAKYGIRAEIENFRTTFPPQTVELRGILLFDAQTGEKLSKVDRLRATISIKDLYALNLRRNIDLRDLEIEGLEAWVRFDGQGRSNFHNLHIAPQEPNKRILFAYSAARLEIKNSVIHYGDVQHELSAEARNVSAVVQPDNQNATAKGAMNIVDLAASKSTFVYDGRPVNVIDVRIQARVDETRAEIQELVLRSPVAEAHLKGTIDDWRALRYQLSVTSAVDLTQLSDVLQSGTALRGLGNFIGTVTGEGERYKVEGNIRSDALAADGVRLKGLNLKAVASGQRQSYEVNGRAIAELLTAGDFQFNIVQLAGGVMGTGSDFRWVGELRAAAEQSYGTTITGLILRDARAELKDGVLTGSTSLASAGGIRADGANVGPITASNLRVRNAHNLTTATIASVKSGDIQTGDTRVDGITANNITVEDRGGITGVAVDQVQVGHINAAGAELGTIDIAGVRLSVRERRIEGSSADIDVGTVKFADGQVENARLARPIFVVEPSGRYRASADLSLGGGVLGQMKLGQARAALVVTNSEIQVSDFTASVFNGRASGSGTISTMRGGLSHVVAGFTGLSIAGPITALSGAAVPLAGSANGKIDLAFPELDFKKASGSISTEFTAETGDAQNGRTSLTGEIALRADRGLFQIDRVDLQTVASELKATGQFAFEGDSNLQLDLTSANAAELQRVLISSGLFPDAEEQVSSYGVELSGRLAFSGAVRGKLSTPDINGRVTLGSLLINGAELGSLAASLSATPTEFRVTDGRLTQPSGGRLQFTLDAPRVGVNNSSVDAAFEGFNGASLLAALPLSKDTRERLGDAQAQVYGNVKITGIPGGMSGSADLRLDEGRIGGESFSGITARATFKGSSVSIDKVDARFRAGHFVVSGAFDTATRVFDLQGRGEAVQIDRLLPFTSKAGSPVFIGLADIAAHVSGSLEAKDFASYQITFDGQARDLKINGQAAGTLTLVGQTENGAFNLTLTTGVLGRPQVVAARVSLAEEQLPATVETSLTDADLTSLVSILLPDTGVNLAARATGSLKANGKLINDDGDFSLNGLRGTANFSDLSIKVEETQLSASAPLVLRFSTNELTFQKAQFTGPGSNVSLDGTAAVGTGGKQSLTVDGKLNLRVLNSLSPDVFSSGTVDVAVRVTGPYEQPRINGTASVAGASFSVLVGNERWTVANLKSLARFSNDQVQIESLTGTLGGGHVRASGGALFDGFVVARFLLNVHGDDVTVPFPEDFRSTVDADLEIRGTSREQYITGLVNLRRSEYTKDIELADLINRRREESIEEGGEIALVRTTQLINLQVEGRNALTVRNNLADLVGSVSLRLDGPVKDPVIAGRITASSGTFNFRNDRYDINRAFMDLPARRDADPLINIQGESQIRGYQVIVDLAGPLSQPQAAVRSEPPLPQADVVSLITTGTLSNNDASSSTLAQSGLGTATSLLTDALINAPAQRATSKLFGLTRFGINPLIGGRTGSTPAARLTVGRRISKDLSVTYSTNVASDPNQVLAIEYRLSDRLSFIAQYEQASTRKLSSNNNSFSFEIRFRKRF